MEWGGIGRSVGCVYEWPAATREHRDRNPPFIHSFIHLSILPFIHPSIHPSIHSSLHPFFPSFIHPSIHSYMSSHHTRLGRVPEVAALLDRSPALAQVSKKGGRALAARPVCLSIDQPISRSIDGSMPAAVSFFNHLDLICNVP